MPEKIAPNLQLSYGWTPRNGGTPGDSGWGNPVSNNFKKIDALLGLSVLGIVTTPAVSTNGTRYLVAASGATGAFVGKENQVAVRVEGTWEFYVPARGWRAEVASTGQMVKFDGTNWVDLLLPVSSDGMNLIPDTYSWTTATLPTLSAPSQTVVAVAVAEALSGYGIKATTIGTTTTTYLMLAASNNTAGFNMQLEPGDYIISAYMSSTTPGHKVGLALWDGSSRLGPDINLTTTRTRYSFVVSVASSAKSAMFIQTNRSGVNGVEVTIDSPMVTRRLAGGSSSTTPPSFVAGPSAARVAAATQVTALHVNTPSGTLANGATYTKIGLTTVTEDTRSGWDAVNFTYTPPESGLYLVEAMLRPARSGGNPMSASTNLQLGFGSSAADGVNVVAGTSPDTLPFTLLFSKPMRLVAGTPYFMFGQHSQGSAIAFTYAELKIVKIAN
jgi:hypothetical protein